MASMRDIKRRKASVQSTQQITGAMKLVSTVKLQRAKGRAENAKPYFDKMFATVNSILSKTDEKNHRYLRDNGSKKNAVILVTGNRGLAGGYNNNICKEVLEQGFNPENTIIYGVGKKGMEYMARKCEAVGIKLSYHNHTSEFLEIYDGDCVEDLFVKNSEALGIELDVGWATAAGVIVPKYMEDLGDRLHLLHIKRLGGHCMFTKTV